MTTRIMTPVSVVPWEAGPRRECPSPGALVIVDLAAEERRALAQAEQPVRLGLAGSLRRESDAVVTDAERQVRAPALDGNLRAGGPRVLATLASDSWTIRNTAVACALGRSSSAQSTASSQGIRLRSAKRSVSHSTAGTRPRSSRISGRRSAAIRRVAATVSSSNASTFISLPTVAVWPSGIFSLHQAISICIAVSDWASSS